MSGEGNQAPNKQLLAAIGAAGLTVASGAHTTVAHNDTIDTGLQSVNQVLVSMVDEPLITNTMFVTGQLSATAGSIVITSQKPTAANDVTPVDATTFGKVVHWMAIGIGKPA